jgi:hypothetical protein
MNNNSSQYEDYQGHIDYERLDELNRWKEEMQKLMPVVELMRIRATPDSFMGGERDMRLRIMGYDEAEIMQMTSSEGISRDEMMANVMEYQRRELRRLAKLNKQQNRSGKLKRKNAQANLSEVVINDEDVEAWFKSRQEDEKRAKCKDKPAIIIFGPEHLTGGGAVQLDFNDLLNTAPLNEVDEPVSLRSEKDPVFIEQKHRPNHNTIDDWDQFVL